MVRSKKYNFVVVLLSDEDMNKLAMAVQFYRAMGREPRSMSAVMREAFKEWLEHHPEVKGYIDANRPLLEKTGSQQAQEVGA
jgi:hypothetical protein